MEVQFPTTALTRWCNVMLESLSRPRSLTTLHSEISLSSTQLTKTLDCWVLDPQWACLLPSMLSTLYSSSQDSGLQHQRRLPIVEDYPVGLNASKVIRWFFLRLIIIYFLPARVVGAPQMMSQPVSSIFPVLHCPLGLAELQACPFPNVVSPPLPLSALSSAPFLCALQDGSGQTWWTGDMTIPLKFVSLYDGQEVFVWSDCLLDLGTDFLVGDMLFVWDV